MVDERDRVACLRALAARLEQLPQSTARDVLLRDVRSRFVAIETEPRAVEPSASRARTRQSAAARASDRPRSAPSGRRPPARTCTPSCAAAGVGGSGRRRPWRTRRSTRRTRRRPWSRGTGRACWRGAAGRRGGCCTAVRASARAGAEPPSRHARPPPPTARARIERSVHPDVHRTGVIAA